MKHIKFISLILLIAMLATAFTGCGSIMNYDDFSSNAQNDANQMANDMMDALQGIQGFAPSFGSEAPANTSGPYTVVRIVDGDTFIVNIEGTETKVRLIGVDTPESVATGKNEYKNCEEGKEASDFTKNLIEGKQIYIEYDVDPNDDYDRTLAYVYLSDGTMLNKLLLEKGYARLMTIQPNVKYVDEFTKAQTIARENKAGFWDGFDQWEE